MLVSSRMSCEGGGVGAVHDAWRKGAYSKHWARREFVTSGDLFMFSCSTLLYLCLGLVSSLLLASS
jgi:hypothetical protein